MSKSKKEDPEKGVNSNYDQDLVVQPDIHYWVKEQKLSHHSKNAGHEDVYDGDVINLSHSSDSSQSSRNVDLDGPGVMDHPHSPDQVS